MDGSAIHRLRSDHDLIQALAQATEHSPVGLLVVCRDTISYSNAAALRILAAEPTATGGAPLAITDLLPEEVLIATAHTSEAGESQVVPFAVQSESGEPREIEATLVPTAFDGEPAVQITLNDVSDRSWLLDRLQAASAAAVALVTAIPDMIFRVDQDGRMLDVLGEDSSLYTGSKERALGQRIHDTLPAAVADPAMEMVGQVIETGEPRRFDYALDVPNLGIRHYRAHMARASHTEVTVVVQDVSDLVLASRDLETERLRLADILTVTGAGTWEWNLRTGAASVSENWLKNLGYSEEELGTVDFELWRSMVHPEDLAATESALSAYLDGEAPVYKAQMRLRHSDGHWVWIDSWGRALAWDNNGAPLVIGGVDSDISHLKLMESERLAMSRRELHAQKLESLGVLAGGIAHDFNNILTALMGNLDLVASQTGRLSACPPSVRESLDEAMDATQRAASLTAQMLAYAGRGAVEITPLDLTEVVVRMSSLIQSAVDHHGELDFKLPRVLPAIRGDRTQIEQVVMNLVTNASEALEGRAGQIRLETGVTDLDEETLLRGLLRDDHTVGTLSPGPYVTLTVTDSGVGMTEEVLARIAEPFFTTKFQGRGLGMAAVFGIIRGHGGEIIVDTERGMGTTFTVAFPPDHMAAPAVVGEPSDERSATAPASNEQLALGVRGTVLIVDDEDAVRRTLATMLENAGYAIIAAGDGTDATVTFRHYGELIDLVLLDVTMPRMGGIACLNELRAMDPDLPVVLMSGFPLSNVLDDTSETLPSAFVGKPFRADQVLSVVAKALEAPDPESIN